MKFWKKKHKSNDKEIASTPDRIRISQKVQRDKSRGIISQASTIQANNLNPNTITTSSTSNIEGSSSNKATNGAKNVPLSKNANVIPNKKLVQTRSLMDDVSVDNSLTEEVPPVPTQNELVSSSKSNVPRTLPPTQKQQNEGGCNPSPHSPTLPSSLSTKNSSSSPSSTSQSQSPSKWKINQFAKHQMCIAKLHKLAREHNGAGTNAQLTGTSPTVSSSTPMRTTKATTNPMHKAVLGSSPDKKKQSTTTTSSPTTVFDFTSITSGMKTIANTSMKSIFQCTSTLKDVECHTILQDGFSEFKEDFFQDFVSGSQEEQHKREYDYYDDKDDDGEDEETEYSQSLQSYDNDGEGTTENNESAITESTTNTNSQLESHLTDKSPNTNSYFGGDDVSVKGSTMTQESSVLFGESVISSSPFSPLIRHTPQHKVKKELVHAPNKENMSKNRQNHDNMQPKQMNHVGVRISKSVSGDIPMKQNGRTLTERDSANPSTSNIPWDERSASSRSDDLNPGGRGLRLNEAEFVSLKDVSNKMSKYGHAECGLHNPLHYTNDRSGLNQNEAEV